jgi:hypothetical protein
MELSHLLHLLASKRFLLPVEDGGGLFEVLPLFPFADDTFFLNHALKTLDRLFKRFIVVYSYVCHSVSSPPLPITGFVSIA